LGGIAKRFGDWKGNYFSSAVTTSAKNDIIAKQPWVGWLHFLNAFNQEGGDSMLDFSFADLYSFLITVLGMILAYLAGRRTDKNRQRKEPPPGKDCGSSDA